MDPNSRNAEADGRDNDRKGRGGTPRYGTDSYTHPNQPSPHGEGSSTHVSGGKYQQPHFGTKYEDARQYVDHSDYGAKTSYHYQDNRQYIMQPSPMQGPGYRQVTPGHGGQFGNYTPAIDSRPSWSDQAHPGIVEHQYVPAHTPAEPRTVRKLTESISAFVDQPISKKAHVYPGSQNMGLLNARDVAIKVTQHSERKMREAQNLVKLTPHLNVVAVIHADIIESFEKRLYIVMEMCNPITLEDYIKRRKKRKIPFNPNEAVEFSKQLIEGINHIHNNNIIHRDLKPSSVLFSLCGRYLKIIDFGMSKALKDGLSQLSLSTLPIGTDGFRAPETYNSNMIRKESDIFSLAILLYHVWSYGYHPFGDISLWSYNIKEHNPPVLTGLLIPDKEAAIKLLERMLRVDPKERFSITDVRMSAFNHQVINNTLTKSSDTSWTGTIEVEELNTTFTDCAIYKEKDLSGSGIDARWKLKLSFVPPISTSLLGVPVEKTPQGYLGIKQACSKCLRDKLKEHKTMIWIDIFDHQGKRTRTMLIIRPPDYDELYGVLVRNPERLISACESNLQDSAEAAPMEPDVGATSGKQPVEQLTSEAQAASADAGNQLTTERSGSEGRGQAAEEPVVSEDMSEEVTQRAAEPRLTIPIGHLALIPWWIHDPSAAS